MDLDDDGEKRDLPASESSNTQEKEASNIRFESDLEFIQSLANPMYLNYLAQNQFFNDKTFMNYLDYLEYFRQAEYSQFLVYPLCLHFLMLCRESESFRATISNPDQARMISEELHKLQQKNNTG